MKITSVETSHAKTHYRQEKKSGLMSGGSFGVFIGKREQSDDIDQRQTRQVGSTIGALTAMLHESLPKRVNCSCLAEWPARLGNRGQSPF